MKAMSDRLVITWGVPRAPAAWAIAVAGALAVGTARPAPAFPPGQPYASYWYPNTLLDWSPATDPDAPYNRSAIPLDDTFLNPALNVNPHARPGEARVASLVAFAPTSGNPSQGAQTMGYYAPNYWQYMEVLVFWGGSAGEGLILAPNPTVIDAAHRNGVAVLGNVFFPPTAYGGQIQWVRDFVQMSGRRYPVADKLIEVAEYYGFDGWFINQETAGGDAVLAAQMRDFLSYLGSRSTLRIMWYDAMTEGGSISWQNALTAANDGFFQDGSARITDEVFLNFWWSSPGLSGSRSRALSLGRDPYELYAGIDVEGGGYATPVDWSALFPDGQPHRLSLGVYRPEWTYNHAASAADFYARDNRFWVGPSGDPTDTGTPADWKGIAHYIPARSPVNEYPFVTCFNTGHGNRYAIAGVEMATGEWNNLSLQDVLPTWRWWVESAGTRLNFSLDFDRAYQGGTSLRVSGNLDAINDLRLYQTRLPVSSNTTLEIAYSTGSSRMPPCMEVVLAFEDSPLTLEPVDIGTAAGAGWTTVSRDLSPFAGRVLAVIGLRFAPTAAPVSRYSMRVGRLAVLDAPAMPPAPPTAIVVEQAMAIDPDEGTLRVRWAPSPDPVSAYHLYQVHADQSRVWLGATPNSGYFVPHLHGGADESNDVLEIEAVGFNGAASAPARTIVPRPRPGRVAHYPLDGTARDEGPRAAHGTLQGGVAFTAGRVGALALDCNGADSYVRIPNPLAGDFTIAFWVRTTATASSGQWWQGNGLVDGEVSGVANDFGVSLVGDTIGFGLGNSDLTLTFPVAVNDGQWHHIVATRDQATGRMQLAVDGALRATAVGPTAPRSAPAFLRIGCLQAGGGFFRGAIDDVQLFNQVLGPAERWRLYWFAGIANEGAGADDADPDGDGIVNLWERLGGGNPQLPDGMQRPQPALDAPWFMLRYSRNLDAADLDPRGAWTADLADGHWSTESVTDVLLSSEGRIQHRAARVPLDIADPLFLQLQVTAP